MQTNWKREAGTYTNRNIGVEVYRNRAGWWSRNRKSSATDGPFRTMREAKIAAYGMIG